MLLHSTILGGRIAPDGKMVQCEGTAPYARLQSRNIFVDAPIVAAEGLCQGADILDGMLVDVPQ
jgi:hypothetical protein